ncbi:MAG: hypothetical protein KDI13_10205 [Alphaproteobacteria bacterium]|nr:hypothetical protein [Alphaproteobacteria bacterium]
MSVVKKTAKASLFLLSLFVFAFVGLGAYIYVNMGSLAKQLTEQIASQALGVPVTVGGMDISLEEKKVVVHDIRISNPPGWKKPYAMTVANVTVAAEKFSENLLTFARISVEGVNANMEVGPSGTNLGDLKNNAAKVSAQGKTQDQTPSAAQDIKVIIKELTMKETQLNPSVMLVDKDLAFVTVPEIRLQGIGERQNGILAEEAVAQVAQAVFAELNKAGAKAGFLEGLSLDSLNNIGVGTMDVFGNKVKEHFDEDVGQFKKGLNSLLNKE